MMNRAAAAVVAFGALVVGLFARRAESAVLPMAPPAPAPMPLGPGFDAPPPDVFDAIGEWASAALPDLAPQGMPTAPPPAPQDDTIVRVVQAGAGWTEVGLADGRVVRRTGVRSWRNNNPGNIEYGAWAVGQGAVGTDGRFAVFPTLEAGQGAKAALIFGGAGYRDLTLSQAIARYAPASENNTAAYLSTVAAAVGGSIRRMSEYSPSERSAILAAMDRVEGYRVGSITTTGAVA